MRKVLLAIGLLFNFLLFSCDEFLLKKTVSVEKLQGELNYDPSIPEINGDVLYDIKNNQQTVLNEIYLVFHSALTVEGVSFQGDNARFDQGIAYGLGICRVKIPALASGDRAKINIKFRLEGPVNEGRFLLTKDKVFLEADKIWLPVPFAENPRCYYTLKVNTPDEYYSVMGAEIKGEMVKNGKRTIEWVSETDDVYKTGVLYIGKENRINTNSIFLYSNNTNHNADVIDFASRSISVLTNVMEDYPFSQTHIIDGFQDSGQQEYVDGEATANMILLYPGLTDNDWTDDNEASSSAYPDVPRKSSFRLFEIIAHEISHTYVGGVLKFENTGNPDTGNLDMESLNEFTALRIIENENPVVYRKFIRRNRAELINLFLNRKKFSKQIRYVYGVNCLDAAFRCTGTNYFVYLKTLINKYHYTEVRVDELLSTADDQFTNGDLEKPDLDNPEPEAINLWKKPELYNISLSSSNQMITSISKDGKRKITELRRMAYLDNDFPVDIDILVVENYPKKVVSNTFRILKESATNWLLDKDPQTVEIKHRFECVESKLYDNRIDFESYQPWDEVINNLNVFYTGKQAPKNLIIDDNAVIPEGWHSLQLDRLKSTAIKTNVALQMDTISEDGNDFAIQAFKAIDGKPFSYVIIRGKKEGKKITITGMIDPYL